MSGHIWHLAIYPNGRHPNVESDEDDMSMFRQEMNVPGTCVNCPARDELNMLARRIGHDLRAPLRALQILPEWIAEEFDTAKTDVPTEVSEYLGMMKSKAGQMEHFLVGLVEYAQIANPKAMTSSIDPCAEINALAQVVLKDATYEINISSELAGLKVFREDFLIIFRHLISNAARHHGQGIVHVRVTGRLQNQTAFFEVDDNGPGIEEKFHQRIFEPFVTLKPRDEVEGSGLGLAVVKKIIEHWDGKLSVHSETGHGAAFKLQFPAEIQI
ncbi:sensor histidine kinase [Parasedimentitalea marina]|uniref:histidine kinase n=1 Tax=Parasedimentitalea marina TaxID=2483033 RepID=A0A3T0N1G9_9RHOB|nr:HAMP domain-containing sensor histidine kinase [Parasedimentitalea marina]AZV77847.1 sensor histidine kinase [Parasedimentitalea marina]